MFSHKQNMSYNNFYLFLTVCYKYLNMSIRPYSFEPTVNDIDMADIQSGTNESDIMQEQLEGRSKINLNDWCLCDKCIRFTTDQECICCFELEKLHKLLPHNNKKICITEISSFSKIILDEEVSHR